MAPGKHVTIARLLEVYWAARCSTALAHAYCAGSDQLGGVQLNAHAAAFLAGAARRLRGVQHAG